MLQLVLWNLLLPDPQRECGSTLQGVAEGEEALQVVVLVQKKDDLLQCGTWRGSRVMRNDRETSVTRQGACNAPGWMSDYIRVDICCIMYVHTDVWTACVHEK